ncbi:MAG: protease HtpX, partial [Brucella intermedia]
RSRGADNLFSTHPDTDNRIAALEQMAAEMGIRSAGMAPRAAAPSQSSGPWGNAGGNSNGGSGFRGPWS